MKNTRWTKQEDDFLIETLKQTKNSRYKNYTAIAKILQRTEKAVKLRAQRYNKSLLQENQTKQLEQKTETKKQVRGPVWSEKENQILLQFLNKKNSFRTKNDLIEKVASITGFSKTTVFDKINLIENKNQKNEKKKSKKQEQKKSTFIQRLKQLFFPNN
jgi:hypothetical protein